METNHITTETKTSGGIFENIRTSAQTDFTSSVEANEIMVDQGGDLFIKGRLNAPYITVNGVLDVMDTLETSVIHVKSDGLLKVGDAMTAESLDVDGQAELSKVRAERLSTKGTFKSTGPVDAKQFMSAGELRVAGDLSAEEVNIKVAANSLVNYINANTVSIKARREGLLFKDKDATLSVLEIIGNDVYVENVTADLVRGDQVTIGPNCVVKVVEYTDRYDYDESSEVLEFGKISKD